VTEGPPVRVLSPSQECSRPMIDRSIFIICGGVERWGTTRIVPNIVKAARTV
jgi:hypothetical protein